MNATSLRPPPADATGNILRLESLSASHAKRQVLFDVSVTVKPGEIVAVLGHNGAGKTTLLRSIIGLHQQKSGRVTLDGEDVTRRAYYRTVTAGVTFTPAENPTFRVLDVETNLHLGAYSSAGANLRERTDQVYASFPKLAQRRHQPAGTMSGGEQRMLAIGMAFMNRPRLLLLDEPSIGLAPATAGEILAQVKAMCAATGAAVLVVDQNVRSILKVANRVYYLRMGRILLEEMADRAAQREHFWEFF